MDRVLMDKLLEDECFIERTWETAYRRSRKLTGADRQRIVEAVHEIRFYSSNSHLSHKAVDLIRNYIHSLEDPRKLEWVVNLAEEIVKKREQDSPAVKLLGTVIDTIWTSHKSREDPTNQAEAIGRSASALCLLPKPQLLRPSPQPGPRPYHMTLFPTPPLLAEQTLGHDAMQQRVDSFSRLSLTADNDILPRPWSSPQMPSNPTILIPRLSETVMSLPGRDDITGSQLPTTIEEMNAELEQRHRDEEFLKQQLINNQLLIMTLRSNMRNVALGRNGEAF
ncbi:hypothetical protein F53441_1764 [Fusarium austroafricanum]|uniref:Uncharacterized protein n=1 Tax=Fusarium austroafricanum TaxID=2364996 RepID=A0A8H4KVG9_9HYPO|nr:hypothetical protein F53441_1764 [Fusarium austroafricanum]